MSGLSGEGALRVTILGSGSSGGVPRPGGPDGAGDWGRCDPAEPKNRRRRCSILAQRCDSGSWRAEETTSVLVDTSPDLREQLLSARCGRLDAVLFTHDHADQCHGVDDLRALAIAARRRVPVYVDPATAGNILRRFDYCFEQPPGSPYPPILDRRDMPACGRTFNIEGPGGPISATAFLQFHGNVNSLGFRFGDVAYSSDVVGLPEESFATLAGVRVWIVDALQREPHRTHAHLARTLDWIARVRPAKGVLTNLHVSMDYATLSKELPDGVEPAYDGMVLEGRA